MEQLPGTRFLPLPSCLVRMPYVSLFLSSYACSLKIGQTNSVDGFRCCCGRLVGDGGFGIDEARKPINVNTLGWLARILQHECDHLDGSLYVNNMVPRTFRIVDNLELPLPNQWPKLAVC